MANAKARQIGLSLALSLIFLAPSAAWSYMGPLYVRNGFPLLQAVGNPVMESATVRNSVGLHLSYSSVFVSDSSTDWSFAADLEVAVLDFRYSRKLGEAWELSLDVPVMSYHGGFMDGFLESYHDAFGFPDYGRGSRPSNEFLYLVSRNGATVVEGNDGRVSLGDIKLGIKNIVYDKDPSIGFYAFLELPTGDAPSGFGSGGFDGGLAVLLDKSVGKDVMLYLNAGFVFADKYSAAQSVGLRSFAYGGVAVEWAVSRRLSLLGQFFAQGSPFGDTGIRAADAVSTTLSVGGKYRLSPYSTVEFAFTEDTNTAGASDVMFSTGYSFRF